MNTQDVISLVRRRNEAELREIARITEIPVPTLAKIRYGITTDPRASTVDRLREYFQRYNWADA